MAKTRRARPARAGKKKQPAYVSSKAPRKVKKAKKAAKAPKVAKVTKRLEAVKPAVTVKPAMTVTPVETVDLKKLRKQFAGVLAVLSARRSDSPEVTDRLDDTRRRISQWMTDIDDICTPEDQEICGPDMAFPLS